MKRILTSLTNFFKDKAKANFWLYTLPIQLVGWSILPIMAYNGDWNYLWISLIAYFLFGCVGMAIGLQPGCRVLDGLRYGKICILADADSDGLHIATLICALFLKHFRPLVEEGRLYVAQPPLFRIDQGKDIYYALDEKEKDDLVKKLTAQNKRTKVEIQRFKGLGEMNPSQLKETTMSRDVRKLLQLKLEKGNSATTMFNMLLSKKRAPDRKSWLESKGDLASINE